MDHMSLVSFLTTLLPVAMHGCITAELISPTLLRALWEPQDPREQSMALDNLSAGNARNLNAFIHLLAHLFIP